MKYEIKLVEVERDGCSSRPIVRFCNSNISEDRYTYVLGQFKKIQEKHENYILLVNRLNDEGEFEEVII